MNKVIKKTVVGNIEKILVYGDCLIDVYKNSVASRISSESPIPVFEDLEQNSVILGGAGNVLNNLIALNQGADLLTILEEKYVNSLVSNKNLININDKTYKNIIKTRYYCLNQNSIRIDSRNEYTMSDSTLTNIKYIFD
jgi:D-beta-D-heptose 7-phosphate kinase/D-beta-D-heptose 1-phosphate adenosyltransferase